MNKTEVHQIRILKEIGDFYKSNFNCYHDGDTWYYWSDQVIKKGIDGNYYIVPIESTPKEIKEAIDSDKKSKESEQTHFYYYTHKQIVAMMGVTRSWTLNNPRGPLPFLPVTWCSHVSEEENLKAIEQTMPKPKKAHWLIKILWRIKE